MTYRGYMGVATVDEEAGLIRGRVLNTRDMITFHGRTVEEARRAFQDSVDDYLEFCAARGEEPDRPYSGSIAVRTKPRVHRALVALAKAKGLSLNKLADRVLTRAVRRAGLGAPIAGSRVQGAERDREAGTLLEQLARLRRRLAESERAAQEAGKIAIHLVERPGVDQVAVRMLFRRLEASLRALEGAIPAALVESIERACGQADPDLPH